jgi:hypothetical protein
MVFKSKSTTFMLLRYMVGRFPILAHKSSMMLLICAPFWRIHASSKSVNPLLNNPI